jgi:hypothetical protein
MARRVEGGKPSHSRRAPRSASSATRRSAGSTRSWDASSAVHDPSALAASMTARPAACSAPAASRRSIRRLLTRDQPLRGLRGVSSSMERAASSRRPSESIHPKHSASSTTAS